jgi:hypothetical protein
MRNRFRQEVAKLIVLVVVFVSPCLGQSGESSEVPRLGAGAKISSLGIGFEAATGVTPQSNVRGGFNFFTYDRGFTQDGISYNADLRLRSIEVHYDWFFGHGFHVSPGLLIYNNNRAEGNAAVPGGQSFTLGNHSYISDPSNPVRGTAEVDFSQKKVSPMLTMGTGNILRRTGRRLSINFEGGVVFESSPQAVLNLTGSACASLGGTGAPIICQPVSSTPQIQADIQSEQNKINSGAPPYDTIQSVLKFYPVISIGVGWRFK